MHLQPSPTARSYTHAHLHTHLRIQRDPKIRASIFGIVGSPAGAAYHASKGAARTFSKGAAVQYGKDNIRVNSIHPGFTDTPMTLDIHSKEEIRDYRLNMTPLGRLGLPEDIAYGILYLASDESSWVTGTELVVDGGETAW